MLRLRRLRNNENIRSLVRETRVCKDDLVYPVFVCEGQNVKNPVDSMPEIYQYSIDAFYYGNEMPTKAVIEVYNEVNGDPIHTQNVNIN